MTKTRLFHGILAASVALALTASAARRPVLTFPKTEELPASGLKIRTMSEAVEVPPPPPATYRYTFTRGDTSWSTNLYAPADLWREGQQAGQWRDRFGTRLTMSSVSNLCPGGFSRQHVSPEEYNDAVLPPPAEWTTNTLAQWVKAFCDTPQVALQPMRHSVRFEQLYRCRLGNETSRQLGCLVQFRCSSPNGSEGAARGPWFFALFDLADGLPMAQAEEAVFSDFVDGMVYVGKAAGSRSLPARAGPHPAPPRLEDTAGASPDATRTRERVANSIRNMQDWWFVETKHYVILSDLRKGGQTLVNHLQSNMEYLWAGYAQLVPSPSPQTFVGVIRVFATPEEYTAYVGPEHAWSSGLWAPDRQELIIRPSEWGGTREKSDRLLRVIYHEAFHQYLFHAYNGLETSAWFNEGHASLFENASIRNGRLDVEEDPQRIAVVMDSLRNGPPDLGALLEMSYAQFYGGTDEDRKQRYSLAWAFSYYLRKGASMERTPYAHQACQKYLDALWTTKNAAQATHAAFEGIDMKRLTTDFVRFWLSDHKRLNADRNRILTGTK